MTEIRLLCVVDEASRSKLDKIKDALEQMKADYEVVEGLTVDWHIEYEDFSRLDWVKYNPGYDDGETYLGVDFSFIVKRAKETKNRFGERYDCLVLIIDEEHWKQGTQTVWGWNLGQFFSGYQVELVMARESTRDMYLILAMEIFHAMDNFIFRELGENVSDFFEVESFDEDVVHGRHPEYVAFKYRPPIRKMGQLLLDTFTIRMKRYLSMKIALLQRIASLLRQLILLIQKRNQVTPATEDEVKGRKHYD